jgi:hypothetical protein
MSRHGSECSDFAVFAIDDGLGPDLLFVWAEELTVADRAWDFSRRSPTSPSRRAG